MAEVANGSGLGRESPYKTLALGAKPRFEAIATIMRATRCSATSSDSDTQQEGNQQGPERRFPRDVAQDAERHAGFFAFLDRVANATGGASDSIGDLFNRRL
jgi:hypothetical protein